MQVKTEGIVLHETPYGETSKILSILTKDYGKISVIAKGCRNIKNKLRGVSNKMNYAEYTISYKENGLSIMLEGNIINSFKKIYGNMKKSIFAYYLIDLVNQVLNENNNQELFFILRDAITKINDDLSPELISNIVELKLLKYLGVNLNLESCVKCGSKDNLVTIDLDNGGVLCHNCYQDGYLFNNKALKLMQIFNNIKLDKLSDLEITDYSIFKEIDHFIYEYYAQYTGIYLTKKENMLKW